MDFEIVKRKTPYGSYYELHDQYGIRRICGEYTDHPYIIDNDGEKNIKINLLHSHRKELKRIMEE